MGTQDIITINFSLDCCINGVPDWARGVSFSTSHYWPIDGGFEYFISSFGHKGECFSTIDILESKGSIKILGGMIKEVGNGSTKEA